MSVRVAVVGLGKMGLLHASILSANPGVDLVAICEQNRLVRRFANKILKVPHIVGDVTDLKGLQLDAVYVTTPVSSHYGIIKTVYTEGIARNVFSEKPLASDYQEAVELCLLALESGGVNMVGYHERHSVTFQKASAILNDGRLGDITSFESYARSSDFFGAEDAWRKSVARGGVLRDFGCHAVDLALWFFGDVQLDSVEVESMAGQISEDLAVLTVRSPTGLPGRIEASWCMENYRLPEVGLVVTGSQGTLRVNDDRVRLIPNNDDALNWYRQDLDDNVPFVLGATEYVRGDEFFISAVADGAQGKPDFSAASRVDNIIGQARGGAAPDE